MLPGRMEGFDNAGPPPATTRTITDSGGRVACLKS